MVTFLPGPFQRWEAFQSLWLQSAAVNVVKQEEESGPAPGQRKPWVRLTGRTCAGLSAWA